MKFFRAILMLYLIIIFIINYVNDKVLAKKIKHKYNYKSNGTYTLHNDKNETKEKHLKTKQNGRQSKLKLSSQMANAKEICWSGQHISTRIINGTFATKDTLPWMVAIFTVSKNSRWFHCGGFIISTKFIISAAHCFEGKSPKPADYAVHYGVHDLRSKNYVKGTIVKIHNHPKYRRGYADIALLTLKHVVKYNDVISPICVPGLTTPSFWDNWAMGDTVLISGWGVYDEDSNATEKTSKVLRKGYAKLANISFCTRHLKSGSNVDPRTNLCIGENKNESAVCNGDSGSPVIPLVYLDGKDSFVFPIVLGVVVLGGITCSGLVILTKVESFIGWINDVISKLSY